MSANRFDDTATVTCAGPEPLVLVVEPWAREYPIPSGATFVVRATSSVAGSFEVERQPGCITIWAWPGSVVEVRNGERLVDSLDSAVPDVPPGASVRGFIRSLFGDEGTA